MVYFQFQGVCDCVRGGNEMVGNRGSWSHQTIEWRRRNINQKERSAADHLMGHRWGIKIFVDRGHWT